MKESMWKKSFDMGKNGYHIQSSLGSRSIVVVRQAGEILVVQDFLKPDNFNSKPH